jgi:UDP-2,4-diacetamido-2,4,6-trideoxy-beta-L-altropyranose hydrolase
MRCLALTQALRDRGSAVTLAAATLPATIGERYRDEGAEHMPLDVTPGSQGDITATRALADRLGAEWIVVDGYGFDDRYVDALGARVRLLLVDDWPRKVATPALLLNQNAYARPDQYAGLARDRLLLGPPYALLRREYATAPPRDRETRSRGDGSQDAAAPPGRILVTMGGADPDNVTARVVAALAGLPQTGPRDVRVVIGAAHPAADALERRVRQAGFEPLRDVRDMLGLEDWADIAIGAAGTTSLELASRGLPTIHAVLMDNQVAVAEEMERLRVSISAGPPDEGFEERLGTALGTLDDGSRRAAMSEAGRRLVDGQGAGRVAAHLLGDAAS